MWVEALRVELHHAHDHIIMPQSIEPNLDCFIEEGGWASLGRKEYHIGPSDIDITNTPGGKESVVRHDEYSFVDVSSCSHDNKNELKGLRDSFFELQHDGSERAYSSGLISEGTRSPIIYLWLTSWENKSHSNNTL
ncbi:hypothetical protein ACHAXM_002082 [Skeletonema potamos]